MAKESVEEIFRRFEQSNPRQQTDRIYNIEGKVSEDNIGSTNVQLSFLQPDLTTRSVVIASARTCDCGKLVSQKNSIAGICQHRGCTNFTCSECVRVCCRCGRVCCPGHASVYGGVEIYCHRCRPLKWIKIFFDVGNDRKEK
jgi:hypothetical protein